MNRQSAREIAGGEESQGKSDWHDFFEHQKKEIAPENAPDWHDFFEQPKDFTDVRDFVDRIEPERPEERERERDPERAERWPYGVPGDVEGCP